MKMKDKFWGLKKDEVDRYIKKLEREFQFDLQKLEFELATSKKENERLQDLIQDREEKELSEKVNESLKELATIRLDKILHLFNSQKEEELTSLRIASSKKLDLYQQEINKLETEIQSINQIIGRFLNQLEINPIKNDEQLILNKGQENEILTSSWNQDLMEHKGSSHIQEHEKYIHDFPVKTSVEILGEFPEKSNQEETLKDRIISYQKGNETQAEKEVEEKLEMKVSGATAAKEDDILNQILSFKEQYINGKVTGSDLHNQSGKLIIPVNTRITKEVIDLAASENKLAELIINMKV
jgi:hypothetical protein